MNSLTAVSLRLRRLSVGMLFAILCLVPLASRAAVSLYLSIDGIPGEATAKGFEKQIDVYSFSWGATNTASTHVASGGATASRVDVSDLALMKAFDSSSPLLLAKLFKGTQIPKATLTVMANVGDQRIKMLVIDLTNVLVSSLQTSASSGGDNKVSESLVLNFQKVVFTYTTPQGTQLMADWNAALVGGK